MRATDEFDEFAAARWTGLVRSAWLLTGDWQRAEDVAQAALTKAWRHWGRVSTADDPARYLHRVLVNEFLSGRRRWWPHVPLGDGDPDRATAGPEDTTVIRDALARALATVPRGQRAVLVLRYYLDLSEQDAATALGCSVGNVKSQAARGLARLREAYGDDVVGKGTP